MEAIRNIYTIKDNKLVINLPKNYKYSVVEIIILPIEKNKNQRTKKECNSDKSNLLKNLLSVGTWTDDDIIPIIETQNLINQWKIQKF